MHDFCFTIPYGLVVVGGGIVGFAKKGSTASLGGGLGTGLVLILAGYLSLNAFHKRKNSFLAFILETACAAVLTWVMGQRYMQTSKIMPAGIVAGIRALNPKPMPVFHYDTWSSLPLGQPLGGKAVAVMTLFYLYKIATGGNHFPPKTE